MEKWKKNLKNNEDVIEGWCGACLAVPLAFAGVGASAYGVSGSRKEYKKQKQISLWVGIISVILSLLIAVYYLFIAECKDCVYKE